MKQKNSDKTSENGIYIDIDQIMKWISTNPSAECNVETTITQRWQQEGDHSEDIMPFPEKEIMEHKEKINESMSGMRFSIISSLLSTVLTEPEGMYDEDGNIYEDSISPRTIAFNTMLAFGMIRLSAIMPLKV
ncbi:MAG: hypothetical protein LUD72_01480 [Bacteroidales bacterium]|nr:hypothetical protein [Bacteroidales bacterium]